MAGGRPSKYTPELIDQSLEYLDTYETLGQLVPTIAGLALFINVRRETIHVWMHEEGKEELSNIVGQLMEKQELSTVNGAIGGEFNPTISKLLLTKHGYSDKVEQKNDTEIHITISEQDLEL
jgi:hypothetical protein